MKNEKKFTLESPQGLFMDLELDEDRRKQLSEYLNDLNTGRNLSSKEQYTEFYQACYSKNPTDEHFHTNLSMVDEKKRGFLTSCY